MPSKKTKTPRIGGHVSAAGGIERCIENGEKIGAACIQIFGASPRQWQVSVPTEEHIHAYHEALKKSAIEAVYLHAPYLVNLASPEKEMRKKSIHLLSEHFSIAQALRARGVIFHIGSGKELTKERAMAYVKEALCEVLTAVKGKSTLIIENAAGGGQKIGSSIDEIADIIRSVSSPRLEVCFDTAHAFEAGIIDEYSPEKIHALFDEC